MGPPSTSFTTTSIPPSISFTIPSLLTDTITSPVPSTSDTASTSTGEMGLIPHLLSSVNPSSPVSPPSLAPGETTPPTGPTGEIPHLLGSSSSEETTISTIPISTPFQTTLDSSTSFNPSLPTRTPNIPITSPIPSTSDTAITSSGTTPAPLTSQLPYLLTRSTTTGPTGTMQM